MRSAPRNSSAMMPRPAAAGATTRPRTSPLRARADPERGGGVCYEGADVLAGGFAHCRVGTVRVEIGVALGEEHVDRDRRECRRHEAEHHRPGRLVRDDPVRDREDPGEERRRDEQPARGRHDDDSAERDRAASDERGCFRNCTPRRTQTSRQSKIRVVPLRHRRDHCRRPGSVGCPSPPPFRLPISDVMRRNREDRHLEKILRAKTARHVAPR